MYEPKYRQWTHKEETTLIKLWNENKMSNLEIAELMDRPVLGIFKRVLRIERSGIAMITRKEKNSKTRDGVIKNTKLKIVEESVDRKCSKCGKKFKAVGKLNRICPRCSESNKRSSLPSWYI